MTQKSIRMKVVIVLFVFLFIPAPCIAQPEKASENQIKAAYIYNFAKFIEWPAESFDSAVDPIYLCILGDDPAVGALESIENKKVKGRKLVVKRGQSLKDMEWCHILYIGESESKNLSEILSKMRGAPCFTVSSIKGFAHRGGIIDFIRLEKKIRFEVNLEAAKKSQLKFSSRLLKLAVIVGEQIAERAEK